MNRTAKVFLASAMGAFIGALVALEMPQVLWWTGMVTGGLVGYLTYDLKRVIRAVPRAWQAANAWEPNWDPFKKRVRALPKFFAGCVMMGSACGLAAGLIFSFVTYAENSLQVALGVVGVSVVFFALGVGLLGTLSAIKGLDGEVAQESWEVGLEYNALTLFFWHIPRWTFKYVPPVAGVVWRFLVNLFKMIHSDMRVLCALYGALGAGIGYFAGSALIGALAGGALGAMSYQFISVMWLELVPAENGT